MCHVHDILPNAIYGSRTHLLYFASLRSCRSFGMPKKKKRKMTLSANLFSTLSSSGEVAQLASSSEDSVSSVEPDVSETCFYVPGKLQLVRGSNLFDLVSMSRAAHPCFYQRRAPNQLMHPSDFEEDGEETDGQNASDSIGYEEVASCRGDLVAKWQSVSKPGSRGAVHPAFGAYLEFSMLFEDWLLACGLGNGSTLLRIQDYGEWYKYSF